MIGMKGMVCFFTKSAIETDSPSPDGSGILFFKCHGFQPVAITKKDRANSWN
jgi:hypothetical protein